MPERLSLPSLTDTTMFSPKILSLSEILNPKAKTIFRFVSILHGSPRSIRVMVRGETLASLESSALLIIRDSLISFRLFLLISLILCHWFDSIMLERPGGGCRPLRRPHLFTLNIILWYFDFHLAKTMQKMAFYQ